ncbi:MAG TPA: PHP domain-containing protein [Chloroflexota bacterium]|nr:PHP domain-containing protein [Chloroflexota bacterium]
MSDLPDPGPPPRSRLVDWHCHSYWSDGGGSVAQLAAEAASRGVTLGVSDHAFVDNHRLRTRAQLEAYLADLAQHDVLRGIEISIGDRGQYEDAARRVAAGQLPLDGVAPAGGLLDRFDYVIASLHDVRAADGIVYSAPYLNWRAGLYPAYRPSLARYDRRAYMDSLLAALDDTLDRWPVTILGHFCLLPELASDAADHDPEPDPSPDAVAAAWLDAVLRRCIQDGVAIELNSKSRVPHVSLARRALQLGARFSLGSDAHELRRAGDVSYGLRLIHELGIPPERVLTADDLRRK